MSARITGLVVERELREALRRRGIWALIGFVFAGSAALMIIPEVAPEGTDTVVVVGDDRAEVGAALDALVDPDIDVDRAIDRERATAMLETGDAEIAVLLDETPPVLLIDDPSGALVVVVRETVANRVASLGLTERGIDPEEVGDTFAAATPIVEPLDVEREDRENGALALTAVLYLLLVVLTGQVANGIAIEKSNRVSEVLLAIVPPRSMLFGKVVGVGCIGLLTLLAGAIPVVARLALGGALPDGLGRTMLVSGAWFVGGLALYLILGGSLGALVSRQEEAGSVVAPLVAILLVSYFVAVTAADTAVGAALAYVPLLSPMIVPFRIAVDAGTPFEYVVSLALLFGAVYLVGRVGAVVFRRAIVRTGSKLKLREILRAP